MSGGLNRSVIRVGDFPLPFQIRSSWSAANMVGARVMVRTAGEGMPWSEWKPARILDAREGRLAPPEIDTSRVGTTIVEYQIEYPDGLKLRVPLVVNVIPKEGE